MHYLLIEFKMKLHNTKHKKTIVLVQFVMIPRYFIQKEIYYTIAYSLAYKARTQPLWGDIDDTYYGICSNTCMLQNPQRCKFCGSTFHFAAGNKKQVPLLLIETIFGNKHGIYLAVLWVIKIMQVYKPLHIRLKPILSPTNP